MTDRARRLGAVLRRGGSDGSCRSGSWQTRPGGSAGARPGTVATVVSATTLAVAFTLLALGVDWFWVAFPIGYGAVLPLAVSLTTARAAADGRDATDRERPGAESDRDARLAVVRERYTRGDLDDEEMERRVAAALDDRDDSRVAAGSTVDVSASMTASNPAEAADGEWTRPRE